MASIQRREGEPQPAPVDAPPSKRDLTTWWRQFKRNTRRDEEKEAAPTRPPGIFGVPLETSILYANVAISLFDANGQSFIYGYVPIVVAKCGVFLKEKATEVEGIFRLAGAERRIKELQTLFNSPDRYGKGLDWNGYTVHDAANVLRRYLNQLPEPIIPLRFYERFRNPLRHHQAQAVGEMEMQQEVLGDFDHEGTIKTYQQLITELPPLNRQLLLYILDLMAVFASKADINLMTAPNLSAIFQPGLLSHPAHDMVPAEYRLSQDVLIFLIENQDHFLVGMQGTAADEKTIQDVQTGAQQVAQQASARSSTSGTPKTKAQGLGRSASAASAGSRPSAIRRNLSINSKGSRQSNHSPSPVTPPSGSPALGGKAGGIHRSNTVPSKKSNSPALAPERLQNVQVPDSKTAATIATPTVTSPASPEPDTIESNVSSNSATKVVPGQLGTITTSFGTSPQQSPSLRPYAPSGNREPSSDRNASLGEKLTIDMPSTSPRTLSPTQTPSRERTFSSFWKHSSVERERSEGRKPNKLQKKRPPGEILSSQSSQHSLSGASGPPSPAFAPHTAPIQEADANSEEQTAHEGRSTPVPGSESQTVVGNSLTSTSNAPEATNKDVQTTSPGLTVQPRTSRSGSATSRSTGTNPEHEEGEERKEREKRKHHWRVSMPVNRKVEGKEVNGHHGSTATGSSIGGDMSGTGSTSGGNPSYGSDSEERNERRGPLGWFKGKIHDIRDREKSPPPEGRTEKHYPAQSLNAATSGVANPPAPFNQPTTSPPQPTQPPPVQSQPVQQVEPQTVQSEPSKTEITHSEVSKAEIADTDTPQTITDQTFVSQEVDAPNEQKTEQS